MTTLRILLGDAHCLMLRGIRVLLEPHHKVIGTADNGKSLVEGALQLQPDLVILDISLPILNGIDAARQLRKRLPATKLIFLSSHLNTICLREALDAGADGYVLKSGAAEELLTAIEEAKKGNRYIAPIFDQEVVNSECTPSCRPARSSTQLTERQRQILQLVAEGKQNKEIAHLLSVSVKTVEFHRGRLMNKLDAHSVAELTRFAAQQGLIVC